MINKIFEALATFSDVVYMVWFIPAFLHISRLERYKDLYLCSSGFDAFAFSNTQPIFLLPGFDLLYLAGS